MSKALLGLPEKAFDGEGGTYYSWSSSKLPVLGDARVGAGRFLLPHQGYALPHFGDSTKLAFVLQGDGMAGLTSPDTNKKETVVRLKKGDYITITKGVISWWYNPDDSLLDVVFIGETSDAIVPGEFTYQFLSGANGLLNSFSPQFLSSLYNIPTQEASRLGSSQAGMVAVKLKDGTGPESNLPKRDCFNFRHVAPDLEVANCGAGVIKRFTSGEDDVVKVGPEDGAELSAFEIKLEPKSEVPPFYMARSAVQAFFVVKGSAWVQIVSGNGGVQLDEHVDVGNLFVVPKFYTIAMVAGDEGFECISVMNTSKPVLGQLANIWCALSPGALEAALNLDTKDIENVDHKIKKTLIIPSHKK